MQFVGAETTAPQCSRLEILEQDIGLPRQVANDLLSVCGWRDRQ